MIRLKRVYDPPSPEDGPRYLVDRLWPRGLSRERAALAGWKRELAPSHELRRWYHHVGEQFPAFRERYLRELKDRAAEVRALAAEARRTSLTLVFAAQDVEHSNAWVLKECLEAFEKGEGSAGPRVARPADGRGTPRATSSPRSRGSRIGSTS